MHVNTFYKESPDGLRAEIYQNGDGYYIEYYNSQGLMTRKESFPDKSIYYVTEVADKWVKGVTQLNG